MPASQTISSYPSSQEIWFDGRNIGRENGTGVHYYATNHNNLMKEIGFRTAWLLENTRNAPPQPAIQRFIKAIFTLQPLISDKFQSEWGQAHLAHDLYRIAHVHYQYHKKILKLSPNNPPNIMHWTYPLPILMEGCRNVVTIHDLIPLTHPHLTKINPVRFHNLVQDLIDTNAYFATVSDTVRQQMLSLFNLNPDRISTLYQPVHFNTLTKTSIENAPRIAPPNSFVFYGRIEHRKNIERLLDAHALSGTKTPLVLIGPHGDDKPNCTPRNITSQIIHLPWSNRFSLLRTLKEAKALLFPSLAEGFGLPIIEAMSLGVPVLTSYGGATEEIAGQAALLCKATDTIELTKAIKYLDALTLPERTRMIRSGLKRSLFFSNDSYRKRLDSFKGYML